LRVRGLWVPSLKTTQTKLSRIDWIPLGSYFYASSQSALFDLGKKILHCIGLRTLTGR